MMMSCGGASEAGDKAQDTTAAAAEKVETPAAPDAPAAPAVAFEKTGNELLDAQFETVSKFVAEIKAAKTKEEKPLSWLKLKHKSSNGKKTMKKKGKKSTLLLLKNSKPNLRNCHLK